MFLYVHKDRHVVVSNTDISNQESGEVLVARVGLAPEVEGTKKRGRHPDYSKPVLVKDLKAIEASELGEDIVKHAEEVLAELAGVPTADAASGEDTSDA